MHNLVMMLLIITDASVSNIPLHFHLICIPTTIAYHILKHASVVSVVHTLLMSAILHPIRNQVASL